jgi:hypothetical protein
MNKYNIEEFEIIKKTYSEILENKNIQNKFSMRYFNHFCKFDNILYYPNIEELCKHIYIFCKTNTFTILNIYLCNDTENILEVDQYMLKGLYEFDKEITN